MQAEYEAHLKNAKEEAGELVRSATKKAQLRGEEIIAEAHQKSAGILKKAEEQIENEKKKAAQRNQKRYLGYGVFGCRSGCGKGTGHEGTPAVDRVFY